MCYALGYVILSRNKNIMKITNRTTIVENNTQNYVFIEMGAMFTCLFEGATSSRETLYYNDSQEKYFPSLLLLFMLIIYSKEHFG
jgi:hypothetical protein